MPNSDKPRVSVITVVYNGAQHLEECIIAVERQTYPHIDHIIVDGGSTDGSVDIIRRHESHLARWVSERDEGLYDAMNKGVAMVSDPGAYVLFANADDRIYTSDAIAKVMEKSNGEDLVYGKMIFTDGDFAGTIGREVTFRDLSLETLCHPATFVRRSVFDKVGRFDRSYSVAADYDFIVRHSRLVIDTRNATRMIQADRHKIVRC